jgi:hypothetical protein
VECDIEHFVFLWFLITFQVNFKLKEVVIMRKKIIFSLLILFATISFSQQFIVQSSTPANGEFGVRTAPDSVLLKLVFTKQVDLTKTFPENNFPLGPFNFLVFDPFDYIELGSRYIGPSPNEVGVWAKLRPNTDYCVILIGAYSTDGDLLETPYVLNFTTSPAIGPRTVSGTVTIPSTKISPVNFGKFELNFKEVKTQFEKIFGKSDLAKNLNLKLKLPELKISRISQNLSLSEKTASVEPKWGVVVLLDGNPFERENVNAKYAANINPDFSFQIKYVRDGNYYLFAAFDTNRDGIFDPLQDLLLFYDQNGDGQPDPINVSGGNVSGLNVAGRFQIKPFTVREKLDTVKAIAQGIANDAKLLDVSAAEGFISQFTDTTIDGKVYFADYHFYSPSQKLSIGVFVTPFDFSVSSKQDTLSYFVEIPANFIDSDSVFAICEANGGASFRSRIPNTNIFIFYQLGRVLGGPSTIDTTKVYWTVGYVGSSNEDFTEGLTFFIDPVTGAVVEKFEFSLRPVTAKEKLNLVDSLARGYASDAKLMYVFLADYSASEVFGDTLIDGKGLLLSYGYKSQTKGKFSVHYLLGSAGVDTSGWILPFELNKPLTDIASYFDSPEISQRAELNGGLAFRRDSLDNLESVTLYLGQVPIPEFSIDTSQIYWAVDYTGTKIERGVLIRKEKLFFFNPATGALVGTTVFTNVSRDETIGIPSTFALHQNYPNPFNPSTTISYDLPVRARVKLVIYNLLGQEVATLVNGEQEPGRYNVKFDASGLPSGIYFYRLEASKFVDVKKMILVK